MKAISVFQNVKLKSAHKDERSRVPKGATDTAIPGAAFSQMWNALLQPRPERAVRGKAGDKGEIEIFVLRNNGNKHISSDNPLRSVKAKNQVMPRAAAVVPDSQKEISLSENSRKNVSDKRFQEIDTSAADRSDFLPDAEPERAQAAREMSAHLLRALHKEGVISQAKSGDVARVKVQLSPVQTKATKTLAQTARQANTEIALKGKTGKVSDNLEFVFTYEGKGEWRPKQKPLTNPKGKVWDIRLLLTTPSPEQKTKTVPMNKVGKSTFNAKSGGKKVLLTALADKTGKSHTKGNVPQIRFDVVEEDAGQTGNWAKQTGKAQGRIITVTTDGKAVQVVNGQASGSAVENVAHNSFAQANNEGTFSEGQQGNAGTPQNKGEISDAHLKAQSGKTATRNEILAADKGGSQAVKGLARMSVSARLKTPTGSKPSALIERIESLLARVSKGKNRTNLKMQIKESPFGKMDIRFDSKSNRLSVVVESDKAKEAFLRLTPLIQTNLAEKGYALSGVNVSVNQFAAQERKEGMSDRRKIKQESHDQNDGKEVKVHDTDTAVSPRKFGYNTLEVTA